MRNGRAARVSRRGGHLRVKLWWPAVALAKAATAIGGPAPGSVRIGGGGHMRLSLRRQFLFLRGYAITSSLILVVLAAAAFRQASQKTGEITVERVNVVDADGTLRMVLAGKDRMHPGVMDGVTIDRPRPVAGMLFFNDEGDEVGGLTYTGRAAGGPGRANAGLMFDQL